MRGQPFRVRSRSGLRKGELRPHAGAVARPRLDLQVSTDLAHPATKHLEADVVLPAGELFVPAGESLSGVPDRDGEVVLAGRELDGHVAVGRVLRRVGQRL